MAGNPFAVDWSPVQNALGAWQQQNQFRMQDQRQRENMDWQRQNALMQRDMDLARLNQGAEQFAITNQRQIDNASALRAQHADDMKLKWYTAKRDEELRQAQADQARAHAEYYRSGGHRRPSMTEPSNVGMREDGSLYVPNAGEDAVRIDERFAAESPQGEYGRTASSVPGLIVDGKGKTDVPGTREYQGQRASGALPDADRQRFEDGRRTQQLWSSYYGRSPRAGHMYDKQGREVPVGPLSNSADAQERKDRAISNMLSQIDNAEKTLLGSWNVTRSIAKGLDEMGTAGRFIQPQSLEKLNAAYGQYQEGVLQTVYALSGKQTTNKEMEAFLGLYMPRPGESDARIAEKTKRLKKMLTTLQSGVRKGMVYDEVERMAIGEAVSADFDKLQGRAPGAEQPRVDPRAERLKNKYGLE